MAGLDTISARRGLLLIKTEVAYCTDPVPDETDAFKVYNAVLTPNISYVDKPRRGARRFSPGKNLGTVDYTVTFDYPFAGPADLATTEPRVDRLLKACGMEVTTDGPPITEYAYTMNSLQADPSVTIYFVHIKNVDTGAHDIYKLLGCRGKVGFGGGVDEAVNFKFEFRGITETAKPIAGALDFSSVDYGDDTEQDDAANGKACTATYNAVSLHPKKFEFTTNMEISRAESIEADWGVAEIYIGSAPGACHMLKCDPPATILADDDKWATLLAETKAALALYVDTAQGTRVKLDAPAAQRGSFSFADDNEFIRMDGEYWLSDETELGDDAFTLTITATP